MKQLIKMLNEEQVDERYLQNKKKSLRNFCKPYYRLTSFSRSHKSKFEAILSYH